MYQLYGFTWFDSCLLACDWYRYYGAPSLIFWLWVPLRTGFHGVVSRWLSSRVFRLMGFFSNFMTSQIIIFFLCSVFAVTSVISKLMEPKSQDLSKLPDYRKSSEKLT